MKAKNIPPGLDYQGLGGLTRRMFLMSQQQQLFPFVQRYTQDDGLGLESIVRIDERLERSLVIIFRIVQENKGRDMVLFALDWIFFSLVFFHFSCSYFDGFFSQILSHTPHWLALRD